MSLTVRIVQVDVPAPLAAAATAFWAGALSARPREASGGFVHLDEATAVPEVHVQPLEDGPARLHLDLEAADLDGEVDRLRGLGAHEVRRDPRGFVVMADPAGVLFCVVAPDAAVRAPRTPMRADRGYLDAVVVDVPPSRVDAGVAFWAAALGAEVVAPAGPDDPSTTLRGVLGPDGAPLAVEVGAVDAAPRVHVDLSAPDVAAEAARLESLGARRVGEVGARVALADPAGNPLRVVPR